MIDYPQTSLEIETLEDRVLLSSVQVFAGGTLGGETFDVLVDGNVAVSFQLDDSAISLFEFQTDDRVTGNDIRVQFTNDFFDPITGDDSNLIVDKIVVDGVVYETENPTTFSTGSYTSEGLFPGNPTTEYLHTNGYFQYSNLGGRSVLQVLASGTTGEESFQVEINGEIVGTFSVSLDQQVFEVELQQVVDPDQDVIRVEFINDLFVPGQVSRDLFVDKIIIDGNEYESESKLTYSTGTWVAEGVPHEGFLESETLHVTGYFEYRAATDVLIRASGDEGTEQFSLQLDQETVANFDTTISFQDYVYRHFTKLTPDQIRVTFEGDQYDPELGLDKNLNVDWIEINGVRTETESQGVYSSGSWTDADFIGAGFGRGSTLHSDGFFQFGFALKDDSFSLPEDSQLVPLAVRANDNVVGFPELEVVDGPVNGTLEVIDNVFYYSPAEEFEGQDLFTYRLVGSNSDEVQVDINVRRSHQQPQTLINPDVAPELTPSGKFLTVERLVKIPLGENDRQPRLNGLATAGERVFVLADGTVDGEGRIYEVVTNTAGEVTAELFLDVGASVLESTGQEISNFSPLYGLRGFAFHPDFESNGKFYIAYTAARPDDPSEAVYLSSPDNPVPIESVVAEWTYEAGVGRVDPDSYRQLFRVGMQTLDHPIGGMTFNPFAQPGDEDFGLLYIGHGDGSEQSAIAGDGQDNNALGKILRIDPLLSGDLPFVAPLSNPFVNSNLYPDEVFAIGFRNPHTLSFALDSDGGSHLIVADVGRDNIEEVNIVTKGQNYGWADREGPFVHVREQFQVNVNIENLPDDDAENGFTYPVTILGHDGEPGASFVGQAIAGGHVIQNGSNELDGQYIFVEFATDGRAYHIDFEEALQQVTRLSTEQGEDLPNHPEDLTWLTPSELTILFDHDNNDQTPGLVRDSLKDVLDDEPDFEAILSAGKIRADLRLGEGPDGELYILNKRNGWIYLATNTRA